MRLFLTIFAACFVSTNAIFDYCYHALCDLHTGCTGYLKHHLYVSSATQLCVSVKGISTIHCSELVAGWMELPVALTGRHTLSFALYPHQHLTISYYIHEIDNPPSTLAYVDLTSPAFGTIKTDRLLVHFQANTVAKTQDLDILEVKHMTFLPSYGHVDTQGYDAIEPGSFFYQMSAVMHDDSVGLRNYGYTEFVLSPDTIRQHRRFATDYLNYHPEKTHNPQQLSPTLRQHRICIWGSDTLDGQKNIWLQQMRFMNQEEFSFTYVLTNVARNRHRNKYESHVNNTLPFDETGEFVVSPNGVAAQLATMKHVKVVVSPFEKNAVQIDDLEERPDDGSPALGTVWDNSEDMFLQYVLQRLQVAEGDINKISPPWCQRIFLEAKQHLLDEKCHIVVYGNNRGFSSDFILVSLARILGIPTVTELLNLFVDPASIPDVIIGPSHYALEHSSVQAAIASGARGVVIQPGVDINKFSRHSIVSNPQQMHACRNGVSKQGCLVIGFVGRLAIEKNPALFLLTAHILLETCPFCRFIVIGDGALRSELITLTKMLGIEWAVEFRGWVGSDLPHVLAEIDILINPSLRAWSETFCIANLEALALEIPLVTFAVGGIGEYIKTPSSDINATCTEDEVSRPCNPYSISDNAIVLHIPTPDVLASAVEALIKDENLRRQLGSTGRNITQHYFHATRQMSQYEHIYRSLVINRIYQE